MANISRRWNQDGVQQYVVGRSVLNEDQVMEIAREIAHKRAPVGECMTRPAIVQEFLRDATRGLDKEVFGILYLTSQHQLIASEVLFTGTINAAPVYPREVVKGVILNKAAAVILYHNHPSGKADPSEADKRVTQRIKTALDTIDVNLLDHFVVGEREVVSFAERGLI